MKKIIIALMLIIFFSGFTEVVFAFSVPVDFINNNVNRAVDLNANPVVNNEDVFSNRPIVDIKTSVALMLGKLGVRLDKIKTRVEENKTLSPRAKHKVISQVKKAREVFEFRKKQVETMRNFNQFSADNEREISAEIWLNSGGLRTYVSIIEERIADKQDVVNKASAIADKLEIYLNLAKKDGIQVGEAENNLAKIKIELVNANAYLKEADLATKKARDNNGWETSKGFFNESNENLKKVNASIRKIKLLSRDVIKDLRRGAK